MRLDAQLVRLIRGDVAAEAVEREVHLPDWRCEMYLAAGVAAELRDRLSAAALAEYSKGARVPPPTTSPASCASCSPSAPSPSEHGTGQPFSVGVSQVGDRL